MLESLDAAEHSAREADRAANRVRERIASGEISNVPYTQPVVEEHLMELNLALGQGEHPLIYLRWADLASDREDLQLMSTSRRIVRTMP